MPTPSSKCAQRLGTGSVASQPQQAIPNRDREQNRQNPKYEKRRNPTWRLGFAADPDHDAGDLIGTARFRAPKPVAIGLENEFAVAICASGQRRRLWGTRRKHLYLGIRHRLTVRGGKLCRHLVLGKQVKRNGRNAAEEEKGCQCDRDEEGTFAHRLKIAPMRIGASAQPAWACQVGALMAQAPRGRGDAGFRDRTALRGTGLRHRRGWARAARRAGGRGRGHSRSSAVSEGAARRSRRLEGPDNRAA